MKEHREQHSHMEERLLIAIRTTAENQNGTLIRWLVLAVIGAALGSKGLEALITFLNK